MPFKSADRERVWRKKYMRAYRKRPGICEHTTTLKQNRRKANYDRIRSIEWRSELKRRYNTTPEAYGVLLREQHGACGICKVAQVNRLCVDHNHRTGSLRGLLCHCCNTAIGLLEEKKVLLRSALEYLEKYES